MRLKDPVSLIRKIIIKKAENMEKYAHLDVNSYDKLITDLIGARILIRFKHQWKAVHEQLYELFHNGAKNKVRSPVRPNESINNILSMLSDDSDFCYFFEEPVAYVCEEDERAMYLAGGMLDNYIKYSDHKYRSIHYIIRYFGHHVELQVRTIFEEGWSECDHDLYYKESDLTLKEFQKNVSSVLSGLAHQADELSSLMYNTKQKYSIQYQISSNKS
jgi:ppGpp synthetase/RelA/SpoT-type nucleotidyltranferase